MTRTRDFILKPWIAALSLGTTLGGWAVLARQDLARVDTQAAQPQPTPEAVVEAVHQALPPVPTVEALLAYASPGTGSGLHIINLPPVPAIVAPQPQQPQIVQLPAAEQPPAAAPQPQAPPPTPTTRSSR